jgi:hypothetical protein
LAIIDCHFLPFHYAPAEHMRLRHYASAIFATAPAMFFHDAMPPPRQLPPFFDFDTPMPADSHFAISFHYAAASL